jgi:hypothetical protein
MHFVAFCFRVERWHDFVRFRSSRQKSEEKEGIEITEVISAILNAVGFGLSNLWMEEALHS